MLKEIEFPKGSLVTITRIEVSPDLETARTYISVIPEIFAERVFQILDKTLGFIQRKLYKRVRIRKNPKIIIEREGATKEADNIESILEKIRRDENSGQVAK